MKSKIFILLFITIGTGSASAQVIINLVMNSRPSAVLSEWPLKQGTITLVITNQSQEPRPIKIKAQMKTQDGTEVANTDMSLAKPMIIPAGNTVLTAGAVFPLEIQKFTGKYESSLSHTGKLPSGAYQLCVELDDAVTLQPRTPMVCRSFFLAGQQLPMLVKPYDGEILDPKKSQTAITFRWTPLVPKPQSVVNYRLQVFEILNDQQPMQALRSNQPVLDITVFAQTQYIWQPQLGLMKTGAAGESSTIQSNRFIWTIQTLDDKLQVVSGDNNTEGRSEPLRFTIAERKKAE